MSFFADKQTLEDLNLTGRFKNNSISRLFDHAVTQGGKKLMDGMFQHPLTDADLINQRSSVFKYFADNAVTFPFSRDEFDLVENYLAAGGGNYISTGWAAISKKVLQIVAQDDSYPLLVTEICKTISLLKRFFNFANSQQDVQSPYENEIKRITQTFSNPELRELLTEYDGEALSLQKLIKYDYLMRTAMYNDMQGLLAMIYRLDVYIAVAGVAAAQAFCFAEALPRPAGTLHVTGLYHPSLNRAVGNNLSLDQDQNVFFLTGANMAGKSTLMKSFGISIYLAHMGFPVAAAQMSFSVKDGLYSSINVSDNLDLGYSHFYAEVLRVKTVAQQVAEGKDLVVIFDELFKGTNVKDAYDATLAITEAFSENRNCLFMISTHIVEVGESLRTHCNNFKFNYLPTIMNGVIPQYTYTLAEGITADRHGMIIIENEGILDIISGTK